MIFTIHYRNSSTGKKDSIELDVPGKKDVWPILKERGITAISIESGSLKRKSVPQFPKVKKLIVFGVTLLVIVLGVFFLFNSNKSKPNAETKEVVVPQKVVEVKPIVKKAPTNQPPVKVLSKREQKLKEIRDKYGDNIPDNYKAIVYFLENPPKKKFKARGTHSYLRHPSERQIAGVVLTEPGTYFVMKPEFDSAFDRDFVNALLDKNEPNDDDSEEVIMVKNEIREIKKEISEICRKEGRKPSEVLNEHAATMYELGRYQRDLEDELNKIYASPDLTDKDVEDFCLAANQMLEQKGLKPMTIPNLTRRSIRLRHYQKMAERKAAKAAAEGIQ